MVIDSDLFGLNKILLSNYFWLNWIFLIIITIVNNINKVSKNLIASQIKFHH